MQSHNRIPLIFAKTALAAAVTVSSPAMAQLVLEEVIVTAQKREQTLQDIPGSVAAITAEMMDQTNTTNFDDLSKITSGVNIGGGSDGFGKVIRIRGVGTNAFAPAIRPSVGIFIDDVPLASPESAYNNMADIARVEILKGPQATLFGKEVSSGAIVMHTRKPELEGIDAYVEGNFGNLGLGELRVGGNLPLGDMFAVRASYYHSERDGIVRNIDTGEDGGEWDKDGVRIRALFEPTDVLSMILTYEKHESELTGVVRVPQQFGDLYVSAEAIRNPGGPSRLIVRDPYDRITTNSNPSDRETETENIYISLDWLLNDAWTFNLVASTQEWIQVGDGQVPPGDGFLTDAGWTADTSFGPYYLNDFINNNDNSSDTAEFRFTFEGDKLSSIIGLFYADSDLISYTPFSTALGAIPAAGLEVKLSGESDITENVEEWAIFTHNIYTLREGLDLTFGLRYSEVDKTSRKGQLRGTGPLASLHNPQAGVSLWAPPEQTDSWDDVTGALKLTWWMNEDVSLYAAWSRGFKAGGHNVCKDLPDQDDPNYLLVPDCPPPFESETADNFELGFKGRFGGSLVWNGAIFYQPFDDYQVDIADPEGIGNSVQNAASAEISGFETDFQWLISDNWLIDGNIAYTDARWDEYTDAECLRPQYFRAVCNPETGKQDLSGKRLNFNSPVTANFNATYSNQLGNGLEWYLRGEIAYRDDLFFFPDLDPELVADEYTLLNASLGLSAADGSWDVIVWGKNLADEEYLSGGSRNRDATLNPAFPATPVEGYRVTPGLERTYGMTLKYRYGGL